MTLQSEQWSFTELIMTQSCAVLEELEEEENQV